MALHDIVLAIAGGPLAYPLAPLGSGPPRHDRLCVAGGPPDGVGLVTLLARAARHDVWQFFCLGTVLDVIASRDVEAIADGDHRAKVWCEPGALATGARGPASRTVASR
jgi:hypothetical protein